jgi:hypothetical protein
MSIIKDMAIDLKGDDAYYLIGASVVKAKITRVNDDAVTLSVESGIDRVKEVVMSIDNLVFITK